jgi:creatinine amidohydrolase
MIHGFIPPRRFFPYLTWTQIDTMPAKDRAVIVQPIGAIEQHGPHLPLIVDSAIAQSVLGKTLEQLDLSIPAYGLPTLYYGKSNEHWQFPGTITLTAQTLMGVLMELGDSLYQAGFRKLVLLNAHGGHPQIMEIVARDLHQQHPGFEVFPFFVWQVPNVAKELLTPQELEYGLHAGDAETSLLLSLLPDQVHMDQAIAEYPQDLPNGSSHLSMEGNLPFAWLTRDVSRSGILGDPTTASKEKGDRILESLVQSWVQVLKDVHHFRQPQVFR